MKSSKPVAAEAPAIRTLDIDQASAFLRISADALMRKARRGIVPGAKVGRRWVFLEEDLVAHIRA